MNGPFLDLDAALAQEAGARRKLPEPQASANGHAFADEAKQPSVDWDLANGVPWRPEAAADARGSEPTPLYPPLPPCEPFPVDALGPVLAHACGAIARKTQVPDAIAGQSVLAAAGLAAQAHRNIMLPYGQTRPLSLFMVTIAASGDRKTTADNEALWPIRQHEKNLHEQYTADAERYRIASTAWEGSVKKIKNSASSTNEARELALRELGPAPERPLYPILTATDPTIEGLAKAWVDAPASLGLFSAEGGQFVGGYGMLPDHKIKTAAAMSELWDGKGMRRLRAGDGLVLLPGRRLAFHIMIQTDAASKFMADRMLRDQGLLSRVLVAQPESIAGTRFYQETDPEDEAAIKAYGVRILSVLERQWPFVPGSRNELDPISLTMDPDAAADWKEFYDHVERQGGKSGAVGCIQDFASKAAEHAARIAGVITVIEDPKAYAIDATAMGNGITLVNWYLSEALRLHQAGQTDPQLILAQQLLNWMRLRGGDVPFREICQFGPAETRLKEAAELALAILKGHGWVVEVNPRPRQFRVIPGDEK